MSISFSAAKPFVMPPTIQFGAKRAKETAPVAAVTAPKEDAAMRARFRASVLGQAVGDALGAGVEFWSAEKIAKVHGQVRDILGGGDIGWEPGEYTDDTQMLVDIAESLVAYPDVNYWDMLDRFTTWKNGDPPDIGNLTRDALVEGEKLDRKTADPTDAGRLAWEATGKNSAGNGGIMRSAAVGLMFHNNHQKLRDVSDKAAALTHYDNRCRASAVAQGLLMAEILHGNVEKEPGKRQESLKVIFERIAAAVEKQSPDAAKMIRDVPRLESDEVRTSGYTLHTLQTAFWAVYHFDNIEDALIDIVNRGDDADTTAAVAGSLLGALYGEETIPQRWLTTLKETDYLRDLADRLHEKSLDVNPRFEATA